jgi:hypothetical protein
MKSCKSVSPDYIFKLKAVRASMIEREMDFWSDLTQRAKQPAQTKRKQQRTPYLMKGFALCREALINVYG